MRLFVFISCCFGCTATFAQSRGYIVEGDSSYSEGYIRFDARKPHEVEYRITKKAPPKIFNSEQLSEFGYRDSTKYEAREVLYFGQRQKVFLQMLAEGDLNLYMLRGREGKLFYTEKDSLVQLNKKSLPEDLKPYSPICPDQEWQLARVMYTRPSLTHYGRNLNNGRCASVPFPSFGLMLGLNLSSIHLGTNLNPNNQTEKYSMRSENADAGIFAEIPIWGINNLSLGSQLSYGKMKFSKSLSFATSEKDVKLDLDLLKLDIKPKYSFKLNSLNLFAEAGPELLYLLQQSGQMLMATRTGREIQLDESTDFFQMPEWQYGISAGTGLMFYYAPKQYVSLGINISHIAGRAHTINNLSTNLGFNL